MRRCFTGKWLDPEAVAPARRSGKECRGPAAPGAAGRYLHKFSQNEKFM
jgi:hypothetical protein